LASNNYLPHRSARKTAHYGTRLGACAQIARLEQSYHETELVVAQHPQQQVRLHLSSHLRGLRSLHSEGHEIFRLGAHGLCEVRAGEQLGRGVYAHDEPASATGLPSGALHFEHNTKLAVEGFRAAQPLQTNACPSRTSKPLDF
jgi:hypothetical protein